MLKQAKKIGVRVLALVIVLSLLPVTVPQVWAKTSEGFKYKVSGGKATITGYNGKSEYVKIPDKIDGARVVAIGKEAFASSSLRSVTIPEGVEKIGKNAFYECLLLEKITVDKKNKKFTSVGGVLFNKKKTTLIQYPGLKYKFSYTIPKSVKTIGAMAFYRCGNLERVSISKNVSTIGAGAFAYSESLKEIIVNEKNKKYTSVGGVLFNKQKTTLIQYPIGKKKSSYTMPKGVKTIEHEAFSYCEFLKSVTISDSVETIGEMAFYFCSSLKNAAIPKGVTQIDAAAFGMCTSLKSVDVPQGVKKIGYWAFFGCEALQSVTIPNGIETIGDFAFYECTSLKRLTIPNSVKKIGEWTFGHCPDLTIHCQKGSYAHKYAQRQGIQFVKYD